MGKSLKSQRVGVATGLLCAGLVLSSCLLPQNDEPLPEIPPAKNRPPRILTPIPERFFEVLVGVGCPPPDVKAGVEDLDVEDTIRTKWAVYREDGSFDRFHDGDTLRPSMVMPTPVRMSAIVPPSGMFSTGLLSSTGRGRRVELIVSDGEFLTQGDTVTSLPKPPQRLPDGGTIEDPTYLDTYSWVVDSVNATCP